MDVQKNPRHLSIFVNINEMKYFKENKVFINLVEGG